MMDEVTKITIKLSKYLLFYYLLVFKTFDFENIICHTNSRQ